MNLSRLRVIRLWRVMARRFRQRLHANIERMRTTDQVFMISAAVLIGVLGNARLVVDGLGNGAAQILPQLAAAEDDFGGLERSNRALAFALDEDLIYKQGLVADNQIAVGGIFGVDHVTG